MCDSAPGGVCSAPGLGRSKSVVARGSGGQFCSRMDVARSVPGDFCSAPRVARSAPGLARFAPRTFCSAPRSFYSAPLDVWTSPRAKTRFRRSECGCGGACCGAGAGLGACRGVRRGLVITGADNGVGGRGPGYTSRAGSHRRGGRVGGGATSLVGRQQAGGELGYVGPLIPFRLRRKVLLPAMAGRRGGDALIPLGLRRKGEDPSSPSLRSGLFSP